MPEAILDSSLLLVAPGRAGRAFGRAWIEAGGRVEAILARDLGQAQDAARELGGRPDRLEGESIRCDLLLVASPDDAIESLAASLAPRVSCRVAFHCSGALSSRQLEPLAQRGASVGSLHPVRAFSGAPEESWRGAFIAIEGDSQALETGEQIVRAIGSHGRRIAASAKPLYHAAATLAAGGCLAILSLATEAWKSLGISEEQARSALADLAKGAISAASDRTFEDAWTGPIVRRDLATVRAHRAALQAFPDALVVYAALARETLARTPGRGKEAALLAVLQGREP